MKPGKALVLGGSAGMGRVIAERLLTQGWTVGLANRRTERVAELAGRHPGRAFVQDVDLRAPEAARERLTELCARMGGCELFFLCAAVGLPNPELDPMREQLLVEVNARGFAAAADAAFAHFIARGGGHLVAFTSIAAGCADGRSPAYAASKTFGSVYLEGLRRNARLRGLPIVVTEIRPGYVNTEGLRNVRPWGLLARPMWVCDPAEACRQILRAVERRSRLAYVPRRWGWFAWARRLLPF